LYTEPTPYYLQGPKRCFKRAIFSSSSSSSSKMSWICDSMLAVVVVEVVVDVLVVVELVVVVDVVVLELPVVVVVVAIYAQVPGWASHQPK
jgi:hypothetical protein